MTLKSSSKIKLRGIITTAVLDKNLEISEFWYFDPHFQQQQKKNTHNAPNDYFQKMKQKLCALRGKNTHAETQV